MLKIVSTKRYKELMKKQERFLYLENRLSMLYWLSEFPFVNMLKNWITSGTLSYNDTTNKRKNVPTGIEDFRNKFREVVKDYMEEKAIEIDDLKKDVHRLEYENQNLIETIKVLSKKVEEKDVHVIEFEINEDYEEKS